MGNKHSEDNPEDQYSHDQAPADHHDLSLLYIEKGVDDASWVESTSDSYEVAEKAPYQSPSISEISSSSYTDPSVSQSQKEVEALRAELESTRSRAEAAERKAKELSQHYPKPTAVTRASGATYMGDEYEHSVKSKSILSSNLDVKPKLQHYQGMLESEGVSSKSQEQHPEWIVSRDEIKLTGRELGRGGWAIVKEAEFRGSTVAAKCLHQEIISSYNQGVFIREISIAASLRHPNLVQFIGATIEGEPVILNELMETSLRKALRESVPLTQLQSIDIGMQVAQGLNYLHLRKPDPIIHRDVSSANILLNEGKHDTWIAKVGDFGAANYQRLSQTAAPGNATYSAPESSSPSRQSVKLDTYSFGIVMLEVYARRFPSVQNQEQLLGKVDNIHVKMVITKCIEVKPEKRPTMGDLIANLSELKQEVENEEQARIETLASTSHPLKSTMPATPFHLCSLPNVPAAPLPKVTAAPLPNMPATPLSATSLPNVPAPPPPKVPAAPLQNIRAISLPNVPVASLPKVPATSLPNVPAAPLPKVLAALLSNVSAAPPPNVPAAPLSNVPVAPPPNVPAAPLPNVPAAPLPNVPAASLSNVPAAPTPNVPDTSLLNVPNVPATPPPNVQATLHSHYIGPETVNVSTQQKMLV